MHPHTVSELFSWLAGPWTLSRRIPGLGEGEGVADFRAGDHPHEWQYRESLALRLHGDPRGREAQREFTYRLADEALELWFADAHRAAQRYLRLLPHRDADGWRAADIHPCAEDEYRHAFTWQPASNRFESVVRIVGPRKDQTVISRYRRSTSAR